MKKKFIIGIMCIALILGLATGCGKVAKENYKTKNLEETLTEEEIEHDLSNYKENKKQVTIYMFRGSGCGYCKKFLTFLNSIVDEYGEYFKLESYEVWSDTKNQKLMESVAETLEVNVSGVPFIVIGDQAFTGYSERYDDSIKTAITDLYNSDERYDVLEEVEKQQQEEANAENKSRNTIIILNALFVIVAGAVVIYVNNKNTNLINERLDSLNKEIKMLKEAQKENVKPTKSNNSENAKNKNKK